MKKRKIVVFAILISVLVFSLFVAWLLMKNKNQGLATTPASVLQDFSGEYYEGDGLGMIFFLSIHPDKTFSFRAGTDTGGSWEYSGAIINSINEVKLISTERALFEPHNLIPVKWGDRRYLVANDGVSDFCKWVDEGWEPRDHIFGMFYLRINDWEIPAKGQPISPQGELICP
jgi:hypothetical protein